jgi:hypothetical protein
MEPLFGHETHSVVRVLFHRSILVGGYGEALLGQDVSSQLQDENVTPKSLLILMTA